MNNWYLLVFDVVDDDLADVRVLQPISVPEKEEVAALKGRLHATAEDDHNWRRRVCDDRETFPHLRTVAKLALNTSLV